VNVRPSDIRAAARRHPRAVDAAIAAAVALACGIVLTGRTGAVQTGVDALDWVSVALVPVPLIWRRRAPVAVFWSIVALMLAGRAVGAGSPAALFVPLTALHAVARYRTARHVWPAVAGTVLSGYGDRLDGSALWGVVVAVTAVTVAVALVGMNQRTRQAYLTALEERARRLELDRDRQARLAVAEERARIARDMHDVVAHNLAVMVALADGAAATVPADPGRAADVMRQASATGREALADMRRLVGLLRHGAGHRAGPGARAPQPGFDDLDALVAGVRAAGVRVELVREGTPGRWGPGAGLVVYRIVQEALTNTLKHAGPRASAQVRLRYGADDAELSVVDDGAGRPARRPDGAGRHGLAGMRERAEAYGGRVEAGPRPPAGWQVRAHLRFDTEAGGVVA
jgi:signal transduction histidine kinase